MSEKKAYKHNKTGKIVQFTDEAFHFVSNHYTPVEGEVQEEQKKKDAELAEDDELQAARAEYEEVLGQKPGNRKLETLREEIQAAKEGK